MKTIEKYWQNKNLRIISHLLFWILSFLFLIGFYGRINKDYTITLSFVAMLFPVAIGCTYFFIYFLFPRYLMKKRYFRFVTYSVYTILISIWIQTLIIALIFSTLGNFNTQQMNPYSFDSITLLVGLYFIVIIASAIKFIQYSFEQQKNNSILVRKQYDTEINLNKAKLELLKSQLHPHFLFNTLNNLYGLTLEKSDDAPELVLRFSELLDYMLHKTKSKRINIKEEIAYIINLADIEKIRHGDNLSFNIECIGCMDNLYISPMLLLPFVENAFKYGIGPNDSISKIDLKIETIDNMLSFYIENKTHKNKSSSNSSNGIGLKNVKERLELLYHDKYDLYIIDKNEKYKVALKLKLN